MFGVEGFSSLTGSRLLSVLSQSTFPETHHFVEQSTLYGPPTFLVPVSNQ